MMQIDMVDNPEVQPLPQISLWAIFSSYFIIGLTAFGMAIIQKIRVMVIDKHWLSEEEVNEGMGMVQLYPGPLMVDFSAYVGYKLRGVIGAILATTGFILPTFVLMSVLSAFYFSAGNLPWVHPLFVGVEALVVGIVLNVTLEMGERNVQNRTEAVIMLLSFGALLFKVNSILIVLVALGLGAWLIHPAAGAVKMAGAGKSVQKAEPVSLKRWASIGMVALVVLAVVAFSWNLRSEMGSLALSLFKIGSVAFGNGYTIVSLLQTETVEAHPWLTMNQFADGLALGQITPGSILIVATFLGYKIAGFWGGLLATFAIFSPSFAMTLVFTEVFARLRNLQVVRGALAGVMASFVGLLVVVLFQLGGVALISPAAFALAGAAFIAVRWFKTDILWIFLGGLAVWGSLLVFGLV
jgi:chromate transporter